MDNEGLRLDGTCQWNKDIQRLQSAACNQLFGSLSSQSLRVCSCECLEAEILFLFLTATESSSVYRRGRISHSPAYIKQATVLVGNSNSNSIKTERDGSIFSNEQRDSIESKKATLGGIESKQTSEE